MIRLLFRHFVGNMKIDDVLVFHFGEVENIWEILVVRIKEGK